MSHARRQPFQLLFPLTALSAIVALLSWLQTALFGNSALALHYHALAMLNQTAGIAFAGFLLTALPSWCDSTLNLRRHLPALILIWLGAYLSLARPTWHILLSSCYWLYLWGISVYLARAHLARQYSFLTLLLLIILLNLQYLQRPTGQTLWQIADVMIAAIAVANFRIARALGNQALEDQNDPRRFMPQPIYKNLSIALPLMLALSAYYPNAQVGGWMAMGSAFAFAARLNDWHHLVLIKRSYVRAHYLIMLTLAVGYGATAYALLIAPSYYHAARHLLAIGALLGMIYLVLAIAGLRHSGEPLQFNWRTRAGLCCLMVAALSRSVGYSLLPNLITLLLIPSLFIIAAFALYLSSYLPLFVRGAH